MSIDGEAMLKEAMTLLAALQQRVLFLAGRVGALEKELNAKTNGGANGPPPT